MIRAWTQQSETVVSIANGRLCVRTPLREVELKLTGTETARRIMSEVASVDPTLSFVIPDADDRNASELLPGPVRITPKGADWQYADERFLPETDIVAVDLDDMDPVDLAQFLAGIEAGA